MVDNIRVNLNRYILYCIALSFAALSSFLQMIPVDTAEHFEKSLSLTASGFINITSIFFLFYAFMQIPSGIIFDRFGLKYILPLGLIVTALGSFLYTISGSLFLLSLSRIIGGTGCSVAYVAAVFVAVKYLPIQRLPIFIGLIEATSTAGSMLATNSFRFILVKFGWWFANGCIIFVALGLSILAIYFARIVENSSNLKPKQNIHQVIKCVFLLFKNKNLLALLVYSFSTWLIIMSFAGYWLKDYLMEVHKYSEAKSLYFIQIYWGSFLFFSLLLGCFVNTVQRSKVALIWLSVIGLIDFSIMCLPPIFNEFEIVLVVVFGGFSATGVIIAFSMIPGIVSDELSGSAVALNNTFVVLGGYLGQIIFGTLNNKKVLYSFFNSKLLDPTYYSSLLMYPLTAFVALVAALIVVNHIKADVKLVH